MKYPILIIIILILITSVVSAQDFAYPQLFKESEKITDLIPAGWSLIDSACGDLNKDNLNDQALVLQSDDIIQFINEHDDTLITQPRILGIFFWDSTHNKYHLIEQNNSFILEHDRPYMDDPYVDIKIEKNVLLINFRIWYSIGSWWTTAATYKFRYENNEFYLIGFDSLNTHRASMEAESCSINFLTKKYSITREEIVYDETKSNTEWKSFKIDKLKTLRSLGEPFNWNFENKILL